MAVLITAASRTPSRALCAALLLSGAIGAAAADTPASPPGTEASQPYPAQEPAQRVDHSMRHVSPPGAKGGSSSSGGSSSGGSSSGGASSGSGRSSPDTLNKPHPGSPPGATPQDSPHAPGAS